jgi:hypothetical protein
MRRRQFIAGLGSAAAWPLAARAQRGDRVRRIGVLMNGTATETFDQSSLAAFIEGLRQLGWIEGQNLRVDVRWNAGDAGLARIDAAQLIGQMPDVILATFHDQPEGNSASNQHGAGGVRGRRRSRRARLCCEHAAARRQSHRF